MLDVFVDFESNVRSYCRSFPVVFDRAKDSLIWDTADRAYIDLFAGAGTLNYGHNPERLKRVLLDYIQHDRITHALDMATEAKAAFITDFVGLILAPRGLDYKLMFPGPTGANAVEAALKIARKKTGRTTVAAFTNGFHGMSLGALAITGSAFKRAGAGLPLDGVGRMPYDRYFGPDIDTIALMDRILADPSSGTDVPAAFVVETVQGEGGVNAASMEWLGRLAALAKRNESLLIVDDIQAGCGRTGTFFSFDDTGLRPDIVCLSKSLSGYGLPLSLVLLKPEHDVWQPGEHNGTFRGNNLAFATARAALGSWHDPAFLAQLDANAALLDHWIGETVARLPPGTAAPRGRGMLRGIAFQERTAATRVAALAFRRQVLLETSGGHGEVLKFLPALTIEPALLQEALDRVGAGIDAVLGGHQAGAVAPEPVAA